MPPTSWSPFRYRLASLRRTRFHRSSFRSWTRPIAALTVFNLDVYPIRDIVYFEARPQSRRDFAVSATVSSSVTIIPPSPATVMFLLVQNEQHPTSHI